jgi:ribonuclease P protein component, eubacterial
VVFFYSLPPAPAFRMEGSVMMMQRKLRLRSRGDFSRIYKAGRSFANSQFVVYWMKRTETERFRAGVSVSRKLGGAVVRNRMRRVVKELIRLNADKIADRTDFIVIVRRPALEMKTKDLEKSLLHALRKAGLLHGAPADRSAGRRSGEKPGGDRRPQGRPQV